MGETEEEKSRRLKLKKSFSLFLLLCSLFPSTPSRPRGSLEPKSWSKIGGRTFASCKQKQNKESTEKPMRLGARRGRPNCFSQANSPAAKPRRVAAAGLAAERTPAPRRAARRGPSMMLLEGRRERCGGRKTLRGSNKEKKSTEWLGDSLETPTEKKKTQSQPDCVSWFVSLFPFPTLPRPMPLSMPPACKRVAPCRSSLSARPRLHCAAGRPPTTAPAVTELPGCRNRHRRRSPPTPDSRPAPQPPTTAAGGRARRLLRPPAHRLSPPRRKPRKKRRRRRRRRRGRPLALFPGGSPSSSSPSSPPPRELLLAAGRLILLRDLLADAADSPAAAALALLRAVASPGGRNDGAASSAGAALAAALAAGRPPPPPAPPRAGGGSCSTRSSSGGTTPWRAPSPAGGWGEEEGGGTASGAAAEGEERPPRRRRPGRRWRPTSRRCSPWPSTAPPRRRGCAARTRLSRGPGWRSSPRPWTEGKDEEREGEQRLFFLLLLLLLLPSTSPFLLRRRACSLR